MDIEGVTIGMAHSVPLPGESPPASLEKTMNRLFVKRVNVIVFGDTHMDYIGRHDDVLLVNPGSPTFPHNLVGRLGTVGILEVNRGKARAEIICLRNHPEDGLQ
jgi:predicted phosphodiesterase